MAYDWKEYSLLLGRVNNVRATPIWSKDMKWGEIRKIVEFNNFPTRCDLFSLLHFCRQLYMFRGLIPIIRSSYNYKYSFWYWLTGSTIRSRCWVGTDSCVSCSRYSCVSYLPYDTHEWVPTQQQERMVVDPVNRYQKLYLQLYELLMMGVNTRNMYSCLQKCNKLNKSHLVGKLLNSIHDARSHVYIKK